MKKLLILTLLCISGATFAQDKQLDSLYQQLESHPERDTSRFRLLIKISEHLISGSEKSRDYIEEAIALARELEFRKGEAEAYYYLTHYFWFRSDFAKAVDLALTTLRLYENLNDGPGLFEATIMVAGVYMSLKDFKKAEGYLDKALVLAEQNKEHVDFASFYDKVAFFKLQQGKTREGIDFANRSLAIYQERKNLHGQASCSFLLAKAYLELGNTTAVLTHYQNSIRLWKLSGHPHILSNILSSHEGMGEIYIKSKDLARASLHLDTALQIAQQVKATNMIMRIYRDRAMLNEAKGDFREALRYERLNRQISDSLLNQQKSQQIAEAQTKYETEKKEQEITLLEQKTRTQTLWRNSLIGGLLLTLIAATAIYRLQRSRTRNARQLLEIQQRLNIQMQEADKLKSRFFANISHEFRTPLTLILSPVEEKLLAEDLSQKDKISFQSIRRSANRLLELINQLLELSKLESGFMKLETQPGSLYNFVMPVLTSFDSLADVGQIKYTKEVRIADSIVLFDDDKLEKILNNLLSNAFKFSPRTGSVEVKAITTEKGKSVELTIEVRNTSFIPPDTLDKIFEPFFQGEHLPSWGVPGTGLGLSLVKELVKLHDGDIGITSTVEDGVVFTVNLSFEKSDVPVAVSAAERIGVTVFEEEFSKSNAAVTDADRETILVVEDNVEMCALIRQGLQDRYTILEAPTGKEGIRMARDNNVDLVVSDVMMPVMNGIGFCHLLKNDGLTSHIPIILLTARADHESKLEGLRTGADDYVVKPFNMQELQARIVNLIEQRRKLIQKYNQRIVVHPHEITVTSLDERFLQKALQIMEENLDNTDFSVDMMSETLGMSRTNLHRKLKAVTGLATGEFMQDFRLRRAAQLIDKKADTLALIAYQVGFIDQSYFTKCFKKKFGKTPSEYASGSQGMA